MWRNNLYKDLNNVDDVKIRRLGWAGHIKRMEEETIPEKVLNGKFRNKISVGKQRTRGKDDVQRDVLQMEEQTGDRESGGAF